MAPTLSQQDGHFKIGFSVFDQLSISDRSLPFGHVFSSEKIKGSGTILFGTCFAVLAKRMVLGFIFLVYRDRVLAANFICAA